MKKRILIVNDNQPIVDTLKEVFEWHDYEVDGAGDGLECIHKVKHYPYDAIILHFMLRRQLSGASTLERLNVFAPLIPVIISSSMGSKSTQEYIDMGAFAHVEMPYTMDILLDKIEKALVEHERRLGLYGHDDD